MNPIQTFYHYCASVSCSSKGGSRFYLLVGMVAVCGLFSTPVRAAQEAVIVVENANIYQEATTYSEVLRTLPRGTSVRISLKQKKGWYRIRLEAPGELGWVQNDVVTPLLLKNDLIIAGISAVGTGRTRELERRRYYASAVLGAAALQEKSGTQLLMGSALVYGAAVGMRMGGLWQSEFELRSMGSEKAALIYADRFLLRDYPLKFMGSCGFGWALSSVGTKGVVGTTRLGMRWNFDSTQAIRADLGISYQNQLIGTYLQVGGVIEF